MIRNRRVLAIAAFAMLGFGGAASAQTNNPDFRINNCSGQTINEIYVSSSNVNSWGQDRLGANVLPPGQSFMVSLPAGQCVNDIRVVTANGRSMEQRGVNTCQLTDFNVTP